MFFLRVSLVILAAVSVDSAYRRVCYYTNWAQYRNSAGKFFPENVDPQLCTHIIYSFAKLVGNKLHAYEWNDESTPWMKGMYERFNNLKKANPNLKTLLAVGGWNMASAPFTRMVASAASRQEFATSTVKFLRDHNFDGLDLDWEYPANRGSPAGDRQRFVQLTETLRREFDAEAQTSGKPALLLSAATPAGKGNIDTGYDFPALIKNLDMINLMTYDLHGSWEDHTGHHSALFKDHRESGNDTFLNVNWAAQYYLQKGVPASMMNIGMPLYGRGFTLKNKNQNDFQDPVRGAANAGLFTREKGFLSYYEICKMLKSGGTKHYLAEQKVPYVVKGDQWVGYEDKSSLKEKVRYVKQNHFGGVMVWALDLDDFTGSCGEGKYPLLHAINDELKAATGTNVQPVSTHVPQPTTTHAPMPTNHVQTNGQTNPPVVTPVPHVTTKAPPSQQSHHIGLTTKFICQGRKSGFYADPNACDGYFICAATLAFEVRCASGLLFNPTSQYCDWPYNVQCNVHQTAKPTNAMPATHQPTTAMPATQQPATAMPVTHRPTTQAVPVQTNAPTNAPVTQPPRTTQAPSSGHNSNNFCQGLADGHYSDPTDCGQFYQCSYGLTFHEACAPGTVFNPTVIGCDFPIHVKGCESYTG